MPTTKKAQPARKAQPAKKQASSPKQTGNSTAGAGEVWKWIYLVGLVVAGLAGAFSFTAADPYLGWLLLLAAILSGIFFLDSGDIVNFGILLLLLGLVKEAIAPAVFGSFDLGSYFTGFFTGVYNFLLPAGLTLLVVYFWKKYFSSMV